MTKSELISQLSAYPDDMEVKVVCDRFVRTVTSVDEIVDMDTKGKAWVMHIESDVIVTSPAVYTIKEVDNWNIQQCFGITPCFCEQLLPKADCVQISRCQAIKKLNIDVHCILLYHCLWMVKEDYQRDNLHVAYS